MKGGKHMSLSNMFGDLDCSWLLFIIIVILLLED
jgi:hypothetical protein